jgi:hypothetical protein
VFDQLFNIPLIACHPELNCLSLKRLAYSPLSVPQTPQHDLKRTFIRESFYLLMEWSNAGASIAQPGRAAAL